MLMLTGYMDESGHSEDPALHFAGMAGFVAPLRSWQEFEKHWQPTLDSYGLKEPFHMKDFAHSVRQFRDWGKEESKRQELFGKLIATIRKTAAKPIGTIISIEAYNSLSERQRKSFYNPYMTAFQTCTRGMAIIGMPCPGIDPPPGEKVAMVYSYNHEYGAITTEPYSVDQAGRAESLWHEMKRQTDFGYWMGGYASSTPRETVQLQAADIFAYELSKDFEDRIRRPESNMRWGLQQILKMNQTLNPLIRLLDRKELLRVIAENNWPCKEGLNELADSQELSSMEAMKKWMKERGHWNEK
jgi:hypothetical protein